MKKILLLAASAALVFASCVKTTTVGPKSEDMAQLTIKINGGANTRSIDNATDPSAVAGAEIGTINLSDGHIFVFNAAGVWVWDEALNVTAAKSTAGQQLGESDPDFGVGTDSRVYVVGNTQGTDIEALFGTRPSLAEVKAQTEAISGLTGTDSWTDAPLANEGDAVAITLNSATAATDDYIANVTIAPVISRLELVSVRSTQPDSNGGIITSFNVTGVYVDSYYVNHTYDGFGAGTTFEQEKGNTTFSGVLKDEATWSSASRIATAGAGKVWGYNVAPSAATTPVVPRFIVRLENIQYDPDTAVTGDEKTLSTGPLFITVSGYTDMPNSNAQVFERGKIYRIGTAGKEFEFTSDDLDTTPNPENVNQVYVSVDIQEWVLVTPGAVLM